MGAVVEVDPEEIAAFCRRERIRRLAVFGSAARGEAGPESDLDLLVEFEPGASVGYHFVTIQDQLSQIFGRDVDLNTLGFLSPHIRQRVLSEAVPLYEAA